MRKRFELSELDEAEQDVYEQVDEAVDVPDDWSLGFIDGRWISFDRDDALPVPENEQDGATVEVEPAQGDDSGYWVTLYHADGVPGQGYLKGYGGGWNEETFEDALERVDDVLGRADSIAKKTREEN